MFQFSTKRNGVAGASSRNEEVAKIAAIERSQAVIEFAMDGTILTANENFLAAMGYRLDEVQGRHHSMFVDPSQRESIEYRGFWDRLNRGEFQSSEFKRIAKGGREVWIQASYNPLFDKNRRPFKVVKFATNITAQKLQAIDAGGKVDAISKSQAVIEFNLDGTIITANANFLGAMGYRLEEIQGKHHSMFVESSYASSNEYRSFWDRLNRGEFQSAEYKRIAKGGREVWIQASYNPIMDPVSGKPMKVVKFATDTTEAKLRNADFAGQLAAISKSQAVIEFKMDGTIITANTNFLNAMGYRLDEIQGKHHRMFVDIAYGAGPLYQAFWDRLNRGEFMADEFMRIGKGGKEIWIQASYNPIMDLNGKPYKVVKYASDVTAQVLARKRNEKVREMMDSVAAGAEELSASVREIASSMSKSKDATLAAVNDVDAANNTTQKLNAAAEAMGGMANLIQDIASQINLLALNATIESARAGEAGKGFAVVAQEVKNLASQARNATGKINEEIGAVRNIANDVATALGGITQRINNVQELVVATTAAVEEQSAVANEMSSQMQRAASEAAALG